MEPTDTIGDDIRLYRGDCLAVLASMADASVDAVMTSPPYNTLPTSQRASGLHAERKSGVNKWIQSAVENGYADSMPEDEYQEWQRTVIGECLRISKGLVWVNHKIRYRDGAAIHPARMYPFPIYTEVIWDRAVSMALNCKRYAPSFEGLWAFGKPHFWDDSLNKNLAVWRIPFDRDPNPHPCAFPLELARRPIRSSVPKGGTTLDPFMGSGTTGLACVQTGRKFIGIELDPTHYATALRRLTHATGQSKGQLFDPDLFEGRP